MIADYDMRDPECVKLLQSLQQKEKERSLLEAEIRDLRNTIKSTYKCRYLRICEHCGQDGSDTAWECDFWRKEVGVHECGITHLCFCGIRKDGK